MHLWSQPMFMQEKEREGVCSTVVAAGIEGLVEVAAHVVGAWGDAFDKLVGGAWNGAVHVESPFEVAVGAIAGEGAGDGHVAAAASGSGREEARRETAERVAGREHHGRRDGRKGIHENERREIGKQRKNWSWVCEIGKQDFLLSGVHVDLTCSKFQFIFQFLITFYSLHTPSLLLRRSYRRYYNLHAISRSTFFLYSSYDSKSFLINLKSYSNLVILDIKFKWKTFLQKLN